MAEVWEPQQGEMVQVVDRDSNDYGKIGTVSIIRQPIGGPGWGGDAQRPIGVTFGDNVLRYFSREGLTWVNSPTAQPAPKDAPSVVIRDALPPVALPRTLSVTAFEALEASTLGVLTVYGPACDLLALAAELVKRG